jgi:transcription elongation factor GreA
MMDKFPITTKGYEKLLEEIKLLRTVERPAIVQAIASARELGDLSENAEYHSAREKQSFIEGKLIELEDKMARAEVIDTSKLSGKTIKFGATVNLIDGNSDEEVSYTIVGDYEADLAKRMVSISSPIARALIGKGEGESVDVITPKTVRSYDIIKIEFKEVENV